MAFADMSFQAALWLNLGLRCLLMPEDIPVLPKAVGPAGGQALQGAQTFTATPRTVRQQAVRPPSAIVRKFDEASAKAEQPPPVKAWQPLPTHVWPESWQQRLQSTRPGLVAWTYWNLGADLCAAQQQSKLPQDGAEERKARRAFLQRLLANLGHPLGTHTFWPACLPIEEGGQTVFRPHADAFWSGLTALGVRGVVVMGSAAARALDLPSGLRPLQQTRHRGHLVCVLWDVEYLLDEPQRYAPMLAFLQQALRPFARR